MGVLSHCRQAPSSGLTASSVATLHSASQEQPPVLSLPALVGGRKHLVDVYLTVTPPGQGPPVFFLLLASQLFSTRQPGTIYQHDSEATELAFFSVFNQAVAVSKGPVHHADDQRAQGMCSCSGSPPRRAGARAARSRLQRGALWLC